MFTVEYLVVCVLSLLLVIYVIMRVVREHNDDEGDRDGGVEKWDNPLPDLPSGVVTMDEYERDTRRLERTA